MIEKYLEEEEFKRVKTFMSFMNLFDLSVKERQKFLNDNRLTQAEKKIVRASLLLRECKYEEIILELSQLVTNTILVESQKLLVLGICFASKGVFGQSLFYLGKAREIFLHNNLVKYEFYALVHLFYSYHNLKKSHEMYQVLKAIDALDDSHFSQTDSLSVWRCYFSYFSFLGNIGEAEKILNKIRKSTKLMHPSQLSAHLVDEFIFYLKLDKFDACQSVIKEMTKIRLFHSSENYNFIKSFFNHVTQDTPLYIYESEFINTPILYHQIKCAKALEAGDTVSAKSAWESLADISSDIYLDFLNYAGDKCLFSLCLDKYTKSSKKILSAQDFTGTLEEKLIFIFSQNAGIPLQKEELYCELWNVPLQSKDELNRLTVLVNRIKKKSKLNIISRKGCYLAS